MNPPLKPLLSVEDIVDTVREPLVVLDADLRVAMANKSFYQTFQVSPENTQGQLLYDLGDRQWDIPALRKLLEEVLPQNAVFNDYEVEQTFPDIGHRIMLLKPRRLDHSKLILLAIEDITERKQAEEALRRSNARNELILAGTEAATWDWNVTDKRVRFSSRWKQMRGLSEAEAGDSEAEWSERIHPDDKHRVMEAVAAHFAGQTPLFDEEYRVWHKSGRWVWILDRGVITARDASGNVLHMMGCETDITVRKETEQALHESQEQLLALFESSPDGNVVVDRQGIIRAVNAQAERLFGYQREELVGSPVEVLIPDRFAARHVGHRNDYVSHPHTRPMGAGHQLLGKRKDGSEFPVEIMLSPVEIENGRVLAVVRDITERKQAEEALRQSRERLAATQTYAPVGIVETTLDGAYVSVNDEFCRITGYSKDELLKMRIHDVTHPEDWPENQKRFKRLITGECSSYRFEKRFVRKDGSTTWADVVRRLLTDAQGRPLYVIGAILDISERKQTEAALRASEARLAAIMEQMPVGVGVMDLQGRWVLTNPLMNELVPKAIPSTLPERKVRWRAYDLKGQPVPPEDWPGKRALRGETVNPGLEMIFTGDDGRERWMRVSAAPLRDAVGQQVGATAVVQDIDLLKRSEQLLRESEERLGLALSGGKMGMWAWDLRTGLSVWNAMEYELLGLSEDESPSAELFFSHVHPEDIAPMRRSLDEVRPERPEWKYECRIFRADGALRWLAAIGKTQYDAGGRPERMIGVNFDITERKQAEEALRQAHAQLNDHAGHLESLVQQRTAKLQTAIGELEAFSYTVAHDLRAPLRAMEAYARELLKESSLSPQGQTYLVRIQRAAARMDRLTQDVLAYSRMSQEEIKLAPVELDRLAHELVEQYPGITAHCERIDIQSPLLSVLGHEGLLTQALSNLLMNACKFVASGASPEVVVRTEPVGEEVRIWVEDKGIGIAPEHRHRIFEMFGFGRIHPDHKYEGTGIGLAVVKKAAQRMGGTVGFDSEPGKGSRFWIQLKRA